MLNNIKEFFKQTDSWLLLACSICSAISVYSLYSMYLTTSALSSERTALVQLFASVVGILVACYISSLDYRNLTEYYYLHSILAYGLMILTMFIGKAPDGTTNRAWIELPLGLTIQPSEVLKISMIITFAHFLNKYKNQINEIPTLTRLLFIAAIPLVFVALQGDTGTLIVFIGIIVAMLFAAGLSMKVFFTGILSAIILSPIAWNFLGDYQQNRILGLFNSEEFSTIMYQQNMGAISIGSGKLLGKGFLSLNHNLTPLMYNDFIFSYIAESIGFIGSVGLLILILFISFKTLSISSSSRDLQGAYICVGVFGMLITQTIINIGMNLSLLPVIGVTLPLFTAGGTSVVVTYIAIGLVLGVKRRNKEILF